MEDGFNIIKKWGAGCCGIILIIIIFFIVISVKIVQPGQAAIVTRFGHLDENARIAGTYIEILSSVNYYDLKVLTNQTTEDAATKNLQGTKIDVTVTYKLQSDKLFDIFKNIGSEDDVINKIINPNTSSVVKSTTTEYDAEALLANRQELTDKVKQRLTEVLAKYNITLDNVAITNIVFTDADFNKAIELKQIAEQNSEKAKYELQTTQTEAQKQAALQQSLTPQILQRMWIEKWNGVLPVTVYEGNGQNIVLPFK